MTTNDPDRSHPPVEPQSALDQARETAADVADRTVKGMERNPLGILVGGLAVGVLAGSLLPRSTREKELLAPVGARIGTTARAAFEAAKEAGRTELENRGLTRDAGREQVKSLFSGLSEVLSTGGAAAVKTVTGKSASSE